MSLIMALLFAVVGLVFLFVPEGVYSFFNTLSRAFGMIESKEQGSGLYQILAVGYMYVVSLLAFMMYQHPDEKEFLLILINAKSASSALSFLFFILLSPYLIFLSNGIVDGAIACGLLVLRAKSKGWQQ
jgi:hypothetical protein